MAPVHGVLLKTLLSQASAHRQFLGGFLCGALITALAGITLGPSQPSQLPGGWLCRTAQGSSSSSSSRSSTWITNPKARAGNRPCSSWLHEGQGVALAEQDPWRYSKAIPRPSDCLVDGIVVEELDAENNFRRGYSLGFSENPEDKLIILPFLRGFQDLSLARAKRRVYLDLGGNFFHTSVQWFLHLYPLDFTEIHVFEKSDKFVVPTPPSPEEEGGFVLPEMNEKSRWREQKTGPAPFPAWILERITHYQRFVSNEDDDMENKTDITKFIKESLQITPEDTLIVKMDIESEEWKILPDWIVDQEMADIVDELFVEVHYSDPTMRRFGWEKHEHDKAEAVSLLSRLREAGFVAHAWP